MKNKILACINETIPYIKELRPIARSVTSAILMQQQDYWFLRYPMGFYKFLEPCEHPKYHPGDSWVEELGFSVDEFRGAFDNIGIRYKSKSQWQAARDGGREFTGQDGREYFYCCFTDRREGLTWYFRNHQLVDRVLDELIRSIDLPVYSKWEKSISSESENPISSNREKSISLVCAGSPVPDTTPRDHEQRTAGQPGARAREEVPPARSPQQGLPAAEEAVAGGEDTAKPEPGLGQEAAEPQLKTAAPEPPSPPFRASPLPPPARPALVSIGSIAAGMEAGADGKPPPWERIRQNLAALPEEERERRKARAEDEESIVARGQKVKAENYAQPPQPPPDGPPPAREPYKPRAAPADEAEVGQLLQVFDGFFPGRANQMTAQAFRDMLSQHSVAWVRAAFIETMARGTARKPLRYAATLLEAWEKEGAPVDCLARQQEGRGAGAAPGARECALV